MPEHLRSFVKDHPAVLLALSLAAGVVVSGGMHLYVTGEPLSASLSNPVDLIVLGLFLFLFVSLNLTVWAFFPALFTGVVVRWQNRALTFSGVSHTTIAIGSFLITLLLCIVMTVWTPAISATAAAIILSIGLAAALVSLAVPFPSSKTTTWKWMAVGVIAILWVVSMALWVALSSSVLLRLISESGWLIEGGAPAWVRILMVSVFLGFSVFLASLAPRQRDWLQILMSLAALVTVLAAIGALRPAYASVLRVMGLGQETVSQVWLSREGCAVAAGLTNVSFEEDERGHCVVRNVFVVARTDSVLVLSSSREVADVERVRVPRSSYLGELKRLDSNVRAVRPLASSDSGGVPSDEP